jgi:glutaredoxin 3
MTEQKNSITIYSSPTCTHCQHAKEFLKKHNLEFKDVNVREDKEAAKEVIEKSGQGGVPVIVIDGNWDEAIIGFDEPALKKKLNLAS